MVEAVPELFAEVRPACMARLMEVREALDESYVSLPLEAARERFEMLLERFASYLGDGDIDRQRRFLRRYIAVRLGEGRSPESVIHAIVAAGDVLVSVARAELPPQASTLELIRELQRMTYVNARSIVDILADDLERKANTIDESGANG